MNETEKLKKVEDCDIVNESVPYCSPRWVPVKDIQSAIGSIGTFSLHAKVTGFVLFFSVTLRKELQFKSQGKHVGNYVFHRTEVIFK